MEFQALARPGPCLSLAFARMPLWKHGDEWQEATATYPIGGSRVGFDVVPLGFATGSFTFAMFVCISCTFLAEQLFMLPLVILKRTTPARNIKIGLDNKANSF